MIHNRESDQDLVRILEEEKAGDVGGVLHCFWGDEALARAALEMGFYLGVGGPVTFKKSDALRQTLQGVPVERLIVETTRLTWLPCPTGASATSPRTWWRRQSSWPLSRGWTSKSWPASPRRTPGAFSGSS